jgi:hypothetical protein
MMRARWVRLPVGANTAIFTVVSVVLLRLQAPSRFPDP